MFERFTDRARQTVVFAQDEARRLGHNYIGTEHILLGLVREGDGVAAKVLVDRGADLTSVRATLLSLFRQVEADPRRLGPRRTAGGEEAIANAQDLAAGAAVGSHHLLEALARSEDSLASKVLISLGVDADTLAAKIDEIGIEGTSDVTVEETAARQMEIRIEGDAASIVLHDEATVRLVRAITESVGGPVRGDDSTIGSLAALWQAIVGNLEELRSRVMPATADLDSDVGRSTIVRRAVQARLARRRDS